MEAEDKIVVKNKPKYIYIGAFLPAGPKGEKLALAQCENGKFKHIFEDLSAAYPDEHEEASIFLEGESLVRNNGLLYFIDWKCQKTRDIWQNAPQRKCKQPKQVKIKLRLKIIKCMKEISLIWKTRGKDPF